MEVTAITLLQRNSLHTPELGGKPRHKQLLEVLRGYAKSPAVVGAGNLPERGIRIARVNAARMANGNVAIHLTVNQ